MHTHSDNDNYPTQYSVMQKKIKQQEKERLAEPVISAIFHCFEKPTGENNANPHQ